MKNIIQWLFGLIGFQIIKKGAFNGSYNKFSDIELNGVEVTSLESLSNIALSIPGMISTDSGKYLYSLCYMQEAIGDVVEIGSWQGRSASFLARAVADSENGYFFAVDHFKGNVGKEGLYFSNSDGATDLETVFSSNMERIGLQDSVNLLSMDNGQAAEFLEGKKVRFLFIDGDHTKSGVEKDIELFFPLLVKGGIVVFDDFSKDFPGLIEAISDLLAERTFSRMMSYRNTLVLMV